MMAIPAAIKNNFHTLEQDFRNGDIALLECRNRADGESAYAICAVNFISQSGAEPEIVSLYPYLCRRLEAKFCHQLLKTSAIQTLRILLITAGKHKFAVCAIWKHKFAESSVANSCRDCVGHSAGDTPRRLRLK